MTPVVDKWIENRFADLSSNAIPNTKWQSSISALKWSELRHWGCDGQVKLMLNAHTHTWTRTHRQIIMHWAVLLEKTLLLLVKRGKEHGCQASMRIDFSHIKTQNENNSTQFSTSHAAIIKLHANYHYEETNKNVIQVIQCEGKTDQHYICNVWDVEPWMHITRQRHVHWYPPC